MTIVTKTFEWKFEKHFAQKKIDKFRNMSKDKWANYAKYA